ncbi:MAG: histidine kinase, partial [Deltaproteobacteria bacterium]|nr:histidine kinase [Deltaproteobacteria bacterium]
ITRSLLGFARSVKSKKDIVDINEMMEDLFKILQYQPRARSIRLVKNLDENLTPVRGNAGQLRQVFLNIILNALQAMPGGGELSVSTRNCSDNHVRGVDVEITD